MPDTTPLQAAHAALAADAATADPAIWITRLPDDAVLAAAGRLEAEGARGRPLWGQTFAVKDNIDVAGLPTTAGCPAYAYTPGRSAPVVERLCAAGALLIGKTNLDQFATGLSGVRSPYGVPRNVFDPALVPGGSSSGSAVAVAAGIVDFALGTDTAGSGRVPAMLNGIVGLKPTIGSLSAIGVVPACRSIDTVSVFARSVDEAMAALRIAAGHDDADPYSRAAPFAHLRRGAPGPVRVGIPASMPPCQEPLVTALGAAASLFETVEIDIGLFLEIARLLYEGPWVAERTAALADFAAAHPDAIHPTTLGILRSGYERSTVAAFDAFHRLAEARRRAQQMFREIDALLLPTAPFAPTLAECAADPIGPNSRLGTFTNFVNLCDLAAIAVPAARGPVGLTVLGPAWSEGRLAAIADHIHRTLAPPARPAAPPDALAPDETALFCVGAHMSGLPLNFQLRERGGRFLRSASTTPDYRFYALGARPGLVRTRTGGVQVAGEVWALPQSRIGDLLALVPAPLGFGTVSLADGPCLGFIAEAAAMDGATDISALGGWRAWLAAREPATV
jgi:allophanate hydrolase